MIELRGFSAWITSDDMELVEFESRTDEKNHTVTCWIAGPVGKTFVVHWRDHGSQVDSASYIYVDGFKVSGQFLYGYGEELRSGVRAGPSTERPFVFSKIAAGDDVGYGAIQPPYKNVGSIVLEIKQIQRLGREGPAELRQPPPVVRGHRGEGDVCIRYGETRPATIQSPTWKIQPHDPANPGPFVTFVFRYRTRDWLVTQGIISPDEAIFRQAPSPWPLHESPALLTPSTESTALSTVDLGTESDNPEFDYELDSETEPGPSPSTSGGAISYPSTPRTPMDGLGLLGVRPGARPEGSRHTSNNSIRSFSGTWNPINEAGEYEVISWDEYRPEDHANLDQRWRRSSRN